MSAHESGSAGVAPRVGSDSHLHQPGRRREHTGRQLRGAPTVTDDETGTVPDALGLLDDEHARAVLAVADDGPVSASELVDSVDASAQTVYRRVDALREAGLLSEATRPRSDGHHESVYVTSFEELRVRLEDGSFKTSIDTEADAADQLTDLWRRF
jgi:DNA-binding transcriptional ArsR family regulator